MSQTLDRVVNNVATHLPGAVTSVIQLELFNVLNDFFSTSNIWQEEIPFTVRAADAVPTTYYIEQESVSSIVRLLYIIDGNKLPVAGVMATPGEIVLSQSPSQDGTLTATVALTTSDPVGSDGFPEFPDWIVNKYCTGIIDGVIGRMMAQPAKPYTNLQLASVRTRSFRSCVSDAKAEALHKNVNNAQSWVFPRFGR